MKKNNKFKIFLITILRTLKLLFDSSKSMLFLVIVLNILAGLSIPVNLIIWKHLLDRANVLLQGDFNILNELCIFLALYFLVEMVDKLLGGISNYTQTIYSEYVNKYMIEKTLTKVEKLEMKHFDDAENYNLIQKASNESFRRSISILQTLIQNIKNISSIIGTLVVLFMLSKTIILMCLLSIIPMFYINNKILNKWYVVFNARFERIRFSKYLQTLCMKYESIKELKIFDFSKFLKNKIIGIHQKNIVEDKKIRKVFLFQTLIFDFIDNTITYSFKIFIIYLSIKQKLTIGSLVSYIKSVDILKTSLNNTMSMISKTYEDSLYMENLFTLFDIKIPNEDSKKIFNPNFKKIEFINVSFKYPGLNNYVIKDFNYTFFSNKTYALVGLNGSGKTTLIKILLNLYEVNKGTITIDGVNINEINKSTLYKFTSAIFQDFIKYPFDIKTNILLSNTTLEKDTKKLDQVSEFVDAKDFIDKLPEKYTTKLQREWSNSVDLSLGQWQKLAIARAAAREASILILDEPTASIDALTEYKMFKNFKYLKAEKLCILVTHRFSNIKIVDEILVLEDGFLKETGNHSELIMKKGVYKKLFDMQANAFKYEEKTL